jgi:hypothetical protein
MKIYKVTGTLRAENFSDKFCNAVVRDAAGVNPENQSQTKSAGM